MNKLAVTSLGSGSKGNATLIHFADTLLLVDNGFSCKEIESRMQLREIQPDKVTHLLVTHEHNDHFKGVAAFANKYDIPVFMSYGTSLHKNSSRIKNLNILNCHGEFQCDDIIVSPIVVPHDAREACQFTFYAGQKKLGLLTDLGSITPLIIKEYDDCHILLLEFNYEHERLLRGDYPAVLKARISGDFGHLSNQQAAEFLKKLSKKALEFLVVMHISGENNSAQLVLETIKQLKLDSSINLLIAEQNQGFGWIEAR